MSPAPADFSLNPSTTPPLIPHLLNAHPCRQNRPHYRNHGTGRQLPGGAPPGEGLPGAWDQEACEQLGPPARFANNTSRIDHLYHDPHESDPRLVLHYGDLTDSTNLIRIIQQVQPDEIYNLGAQSHVAVSFESPEYTANSDALGTLRIRRGHECFRRQYRNSCDGGSRGPKQRPRVGDGRSPFDHSPEM